MPFIEAFTSDDTNCHCENEISFKWGFRLLKKYILRLDDISWDMNYENFSRIKEILIKYDVKPIIGVIPDNKDEKLKSYIGKTHISPQCFWEQIRELQFKYKWTIAMHGYDHVYISQNGGMFHINDKSEFAGVSYEIQKEKIERGKDILERNGLMVNIFMAPAHSLDWITIKVLQEHGFLYVTDGDTAYPYEEQGMKFVPQQWPWPHRGLIGIETAAFHVNSWDEKRFNMFERFLKRNAKRCISFEDSISDFNKYNNRKYIVLNNCYRKLLPITRRWFDTLSDFKRAIKNA